MMSLNIRWRLTLWNLLAVTALLIGFAVLVYALVSHALYEKTDSDLLVGARLLEHDGRLATEGTERLKYLIQELHEHQDLACVAFAPGGSAIARTDALASDSVPPAPTAHEDHAFQDVTLPIIGRQRELVTRAQVGNEITTLVLLATLHEVDHQLGEVRTALASAIPVGIVLAGGVGYFLARRALAPVDRLRTMTDEVTAERLDRRLPVANPHDEMGQLAQTINAMIARLERSFAEVRRFTADASHELRTPLTVLRTEVEVALGKPMSPDETAQLLGSTLEECERLTRLTDQLLTLARQDASPITGANEPVGLVECLASVVETMRPLAEAREVDLHFSPGDQTISAQLLGEAALLRQVFINLLDNAIKYSTPGGSVEVGVRIDKVNATVSVADAGEGIAAEHLPHVFNRFYRVDKARTRAAGGSGLGLSIARSIVEAHGGRIQLESTPGRGTTVTVVLSLGNMR
jgi:heavy metal sensor kinase